MSGSQPALNALNFFMAHQVGRNEAFNHAGNVAAAVLAGALGYRFGIGAVFVVMAAMALASLIATWWIDPARIDHRAARGLPDEGHDGHGSGWSTLTASKPLLVLAATLLLFHLGNAAMLPLLGQSLAALGGWVAEKFGYAASFIALGALAVLALALWLATRRVTAQYGGRP